MYSGIDHDKIEPIAIELADGDHPYTRWCDIARAYLTLKAENERLRKLARAAEVLNDSEGYGTEGNSDWDRLRENIEACKG